MMINVRGLTDLAMILPIKITRSYEAMILPIKITKLKEKGVDTFGHEAEGRSSMLIPS